MEPSGQPPGERRAAPRLDSTLKLACYPVGSGLRERRQARVRNVSRTGIGLLVDRPWQTGTILIVEFPPTEDTAKAVRARVIHATAQLGGLFLVGCSFEPSLTDTEVQLLVK